MVDLSLVFLNAKAPGYISSPKKDDFSNFVATVC
jgi:hypothetical protein